MSAPPEVLTAERVASLYEAIQRVRDLHRPAATADYPEWIGCAHCGIANNPWPCETLRVLDDARPWGDR